ncbi:protein-L-isoaspartate(D-aspartate) O-methyltransferase [Blastopirellula retiformator]|uniref:Protein-L-isoaspartate O-methyltransferase n=1 Tax=Blastopirellula retiformator TaxID=2527970 RepID=A0A5C5VKD4_9BACT|nr:protein-L-isoaspartate(D-aspartate) O-methyltransferase [Blastopirellula retiformator]TWT39068.1 Protein-L-isoaspartate O-methyltransferase [Blastopirellula retiformator]
MYSACSSDEMAKYAALRKEVVMRQLRGRDIRDTAVLSAMGDVPRHEFLPPRQRRLAYDDCAVALSSGQTISQPYIVALMSQLAEIQPGARVLDIGAGSGYQSAVLAEMGAEVYAIEILPELAAAAKERLCRLGDGDVHLRQGDGYAGWPTAAPFDAILIAAAAPKIPPLLPAQLATGGRLILPVGEGAQVLQCVHKLAEDKFECRNVSAVQFVPMVGQVRQ